MNLVGAVYIREDLGHRGEGLDRNIAADFKRDQDFGQVGILAHVDSFRPGNRDDLLGDGTPAAGDDARQGLRRAVMAQRHGDVAQRRQRLGVARCFGRRISGAPVRAA